MFAQIMLSKIDQNSNNSSVFFVSMNVKGMTENIYEYNSDFYDYKFKFVDVKITSVGKLIKPWVHQQKMTDNNGTDAANSGSTSQVK